MTQKPAPSADERRQFIQSNTTVREVPFVPELRLHVAELATELWQKTEDELDHIGLPPPFWAFAWAGGQGLARYILDHPETVRGKRVLDFASGSGLVAIAAAKAGAICVEASEIDAYAAEAISLNASINKVGVTVHHADLVSTDDGWDCVLAGDICYQQDMAAKVMSWLKTMHMRGAVILIGDPGRAYLPVDELREQAVYRVPVTRDLEDADEKSVSVYTFR
jgi:predicted nicotinamide N-methyase